MTDGRSTTLRAIHAVQGQALRDAAKALNDSAVVPWLCPAQECDVDFADWLLKRAEQIEVGEL